MRRIITAERTMGGEIKLINTVEARAGRTAGLCTGHAVEATSSGGVGSTTNKISRTNISRSKSKAKGGCLSR